MKHYRTKLRRTIFFAVLLSVIQLLFSCASAPAAAVTDINAMEWYEIPGQIVRIAKDNSYEKSRGNNQNNFDTDRGEAGGVCYRVVEPFLINSTSFTVADIEDVLLHPNGYTFSKTYLSMRRNEKDEHIVPLKNVYLEWQQFENKYRLPVYHANSSSQALRGEYASSKNPISIYEWKVLLNALSEKYGFTPVYWSVSNGEVHPLRKNERTDYLFELESADGFRILSEAERIAALNTLDFRKKLIQDGISFSTFNVDGYSTNEKPLVNVEDTYYDNITFTAVNAFYWESDAKKLKDSLFIVRRIPSIQNNEQEK